MKKTALLALLPLVLTACAAEKADDWQPLFNGRNLDGWKASENPGTFSVQNGAIVVKGVRSHLFYVGAIGQGGNFKNFEFKCDVLTKPGANSGVYFHTEFQGPGWPAKGYEVQVNNSHGDPSRTAGLYAVRDNPKVLARDNEWFTLAIKVEGKHVVTSVNGQVVVDYTEEPNPPRQGMYVTRLIKSGTFALQGHDPGSEVHFKNLLVKPLP
jgi:hypothetical protein